MRTPFGGCHGRRGRGRKQQWNQSAAVAVGLSVTVPAKRLTDWPSWGYSLQTAHGPRVQTVSRGTSSHRPSSGATADCRSTVPSGPTLARIRPPRQPDPDWRQSANSAPGYGKRQLPGPAFALLRSSRRLALVV